MLLVKHLLNNTTVTAISFQRICQNKTKKKTIKKKQTKNSRHVASFLKVGEGGGRLIQKFLTSKKKKPTTKNGNNLLVTLCILMIVFNSLQ